MSFQVVFSKFLAMMATTWWIVAMIFFLALAFAPHNSEVIAIF
jgi:hypothetical protein